MTRALLLDQPKQPSFGNTLDALSYVAYTAPMLLETRSRHVRADQPSTPVRRAVAALARDLGVLLLVLMAALLLITIGYLPHRSIVITPDTASATVRQSGFNEPERFSDRPGRFRWTQGVATMTLPNLGGATNVQLLLAAGPERSVPTTLRAGEHTLVLDVGSAPRIYHVQLPPAPGSHITLQIASSTLSEASSQRTLGVVVGDISLQGGGAAPSDVRTLFVAASAALFVLGRLAFRRRALSAGAVLLLGTLALLWLTLGGWRTGAITSVLLAAAIPLGALLAAVWLPSLFVAASTPGEPHAGSTNSWRPALTAERAAIWRAYQFWQAHGKTPVLIGLSALTLLLLFVRTRTQFVAQDFGLDPSWFLELEYQLRGGHIMGRDAYFTYGPLSQLIMVGGMALRGGGSVLRGFSTGYLMFEITSVVLFALAIAGIRQVRGAGALFIFSMCFLLDGVMNMRQGMVLLSVVVLVRVLDAPQRRRRWQSGLVGLLWFAAQLLTAEVGVYAVVGGVGLLLLSAALGWQRLGLRTDMHPPRIYLETLGLALGALLGLNLLLELAFRLSSPTYQWLDYFRYTAAILTAYNYSMGMGWLLGSLPSLVLLLVLLFCGLAGLARLRRADRSTFHLVAGLGIGALLSLKSAVVRSDAGHIMMAATLLIFLFVLLIYLSDGRSPTLFAGATLLALTLITWPSTPVGTLRLIPQLARGDITVSQQWRAIRSITVAPELIAPPELRQAVDPSKQLVNFPFDNVIAMALDQPSLAPVLQTYSAHNNLLQAKYAAEIERRRQSVEVIYGLDGLATGGVDGVQNVSRVPGIFRYLAENFALKTTQLFRNGYVVLQARPQPRPLVAPSLPFAITSDQNALSLALEQPASCALVELDLQMNYPVTALVGRPRGLVADIFSGRSTVVHTNIVAVEHDKPFTTYIYLGQPAAFASLFSDEPEPDARATFNQIRLTPPPASVFDVRPSSVDVTGLRCVQPGG